MTKHVLLALLFAPIAAGCGSNNPTTTTTGNAAHNPATAAYAYTRCMRSHGVPNFPDPHVAVSGAGHAAVGFAVNPSETGSPKFKSADKACSGILPGPASPSQQRAQEQARKETLLAFARCLRAHGLHDFPDPNQQGQLPLPTVIAAGVDIHSRAFLDAARACVGVTHGAITMQEIEAGVKGGGSGSQSSGGG